MLFSLIVGWLTKRIWPTGILIVLGISTAWALIGFLQDQSMNSTRQILGGTLRPNGVGIVAAGFLIDVAINFVLFLLARFLRSKIRPHADKPDVN